MRKVKINGALWTYEVDVDMTTLKSPSGVTYYIDTLKLPKPVTNKVIAMYVQYQKVF